MPKPPMPLLALSLVLPLGLVSGCSLLGGGPDSAQPAADAPPAPAAGLDALLVVFKGNALGAQITDQDRHLAEDAGRKAMAAPVGQVEHWRDAASGHDGTVTSTREGYNPAGVYCREFQVTLMVAGKGAQAFGETCRSPDGSWKIVN
jgi:surface antigen